MAGVLGWEQVAIATGGTLSPTPRPSTLASAGLRVHVLHIRVSTVHLGTLQAAARAARLGAPPRGD